MAALLHRGQANARVEDVDFNPDDFVARVNSDLVGKYVNIASRAATFVNRFFDGKLAATATDPADAQLRRATELEAEVAAAYEDREFGRAIRLIMGYADETNQYFDAHKPWELAKDPSRRDALHEVCSRCLVAFHRLTIMLKPILPATAGRVEAFFGTPDLRWDDLGVRPGTQSPAHAIGRYEHLMTRVDPKMFDALFEPPPAQAPAGAAAQAVPVAEPPISIDDFARVDLRIARIVAADAVEGSDKLLRLTLDVGDRRPRNVFSGIKAAYDPARLVGRMTVVVANLAPRKMKFGVSEGMVLSASADDPSQPSGLYLLDVDDGAKPGMKVR